MLRHPRRVNLWLEKSDGDSPSFSTPMSVRYVTQEERAALVKAKKEAALAKLEEAAGAMRILQVVKASGRPLVGHNFLLDLLFLYSHFVKPVLPETAMGFKTKLPRYLPDVRNNVTRPCLYYGGVIRRVGMVLFLPPANPPFCRCTTRRCWPRPWASRTGRGIPTWRGSTTASALQRKGKEG